MKCATCGAWTFVLTTRKADGGRTLRRRRECANAHRFTTLETIVKKP